MTKAGFHNQLIKILYAQLQTFQTYLSEMVNAEYITHL